MPEPVITTLNNRNSHDETVLFDIFRIAQCEQQGRSHLYLEGWFNPIIRSHFKFVDDSLECPFSMGRIKRYKDMYLVGCNYPPSTNDFKFIDEVTEIPTTLEGDSK